MAQPVEGIRANDPRPSLLTSARKLPFGYTPTIGADGIPTTPGWQQGITFRDTALQVGSRWPYSPGTVHADKTAAVQAGVPVFIPFTVYLPVQCDEATYAREDELMAEALANGGAVTAFEIANELWSGATLNSVVPNNPSLQAPFPGAASPFVTAHVLAGTFNPIAAMGALLEAYFDATHKGGATLHAPASLSSYLLSEKVIGQQGDIYVGPMGSIVIMGPGYPAGAGAFGPKTSGTPTGLLATAAQAWMYVTGPVEWDATEPKILPEERRLRYADQRTNLWRIWAERQAIYRFDPSAVFAVLVTVPTAE